MFPFFATLMECSQCNGGELVFFTKVFAWVLGILNSGSWNLPAHGCGKRLWRNSRWLLLLLLAFTASGLQRLRLALAHAGAFSFYRPSAFSRSRRHLLALPVFYWYLPLHPRSFIAIALLFYHPYASILKARTGPLSVPLLYNLRSSCCRQLPLRGLEEKRGARQRSRA